MAYDPLDPDADGTVESLPAEEVSVEDTSQDPTANGEVRRNGADLKAYTGGGVKNLSNIGTGGDEWTEDGNSPATASAATSITYTTASAWDLLKIYLKFTDQAGNQTNPWMEIEGVTTADYIYVDNSGAQTAGASNLPQVAAIPANGGARRLMFMQAAGGEPTVEVLPKAGNTGDLDNGRLVSSQFDGQVNQFTFDRGQSTDWTVEVYGRNL